MRAALLRTREEKVNFGTADRGLVYTIRLCPNWLERICGDLECDVNIYVTTRGHFRHWPSDLFVLDSSDLGKLFEKVITHTPREPVPAARVVKRAT